ncbi:MAG: NAD(P)/FAD-dependent oxidoreductase [Bacteroidales bacterium]|nr:NAD(P)/FAD-dependent oxidoreductase [Bacteroidales bacterium]MCF8388104.1 NAD(P)/FAD-dependent oxidoreductase [Bacteroidales bacterium]MCF8398714.1 NAD(P)/FAD-dependent oxidoreductase [Bacteroidales bacterium]
MSLNIPQTEKERIVVVGGGFGGLNFLKKINRKKFQIVLIDKNNYHNFQPLLYQVSMGGLEPDSIAYPLRKYVKGLGKEVFFRLCELQEIKPKEKKVITSRGELEYEHLVMAAGSQTNFFGNEAIKNYGLELKSVPNALDIRSIVLQNLEMALMTDDKEERKKLLNFVIVGGGPTGVELAGALSELKKFVFRKEYHDLDISEMNIYLLEGMDRLLGSMSEKASQKTYQYLEKLGTRIFLNTMVEDYDGEKVHTGDDNFIASFNLIWTAGVKGWVPKGIPDNLIAKGNRIKVNKYCQAEGIDNLFVIGDAAAMISKESTNGHPMLAQVAIQMGKQVAQNLNRIKKGKEPEAFHYNDKGVMATIGRKKAVADFKTLKLQGFLAWIVWLFVHLMFLVGYQNKLVVMLNWFIGYVNYDSPLRLIIRPFKK